jgi:hypothetical protein
MVPVAMWGNTYVVNHVSQGPVIKGTEVPPSPKIIEGELTETVGPLIATPLDDKSMRTLRSSDLICIEVVE